MGNETNDQDNTIRVKLLKEFLKISEEHGKDRVSKIFREFVFFVLADEQLTKKLYEKGGAK